MSLSLLSSHCVFTVRDIVNLARGAEPLAFNASCSENTLDTSLYIVVLRKTYILHPQEELAAGEEIAHCPSCSLYITVIYNPVSCPANHGLYHLSTVDDDMYIDLHF